MTTANDQLVEALRTSLKETERLRGQNRKLVAAKDEPVAIVGVGCRFPGGVVSAAGLWDLVASGQDAIGPFPANRGWDPASVFDPVPGAVGKSYTRHGGFLYDADRFDPGFFGISPNEALVMDPQQRLLLETAWEAFESAGIDPRSLRGSDTGVFAGMMYHDYAANSSTGAVASGRVSYVFGLQGPCLTVDTACSSSLVALHLAVQALRSGECSLALAGGVAVMATPEVFVEFSRQGGLAPDGRCKSFDAGADGTAWGEGAGLLLVERLSDARRLGHAVLAVVRGTAVNQDGASNGLTAPNGPAQEKVIRAALASARLSTADVDLVEAHGTGTVLGDPIEAQALLATYGQDRPEGRPLYLGSIKSNIGHTQAAAGVAGIIKMVEAMRHGVMPKSLHLGAPSPHVDWSAGDVELLAEAREWPETGRLRRAAISSFGISGTNAHVILEQPEAQVAAASDEPGASGPAGSAPAGSAQASMPETSGVVPWVVSARSVEAVREQASRIAAQVRGSGVGVADVAETLAHRAVFDHRLVVPASEVEQACAALETASVIRAGGGRVGVVFTGQGSQRVGMGRELYARFPVFAAALDEVLDPAVCELMWGENGEALSQTGMAQPALFAIEVALFRLLESFGIAPAAMAGHSIGEVAAAHVAGVLSLADARTLVSARASLMQQLPAGGAMLAVNATEQQVGHLLSDDLAIAAVNAPGQVVLSGTAAAVERAAELLTGAGVAPDQDGAVPGGPVRVRRLSVSHAFHSPLMDPMLPAFAEAIAGLSFAEPTVPIVSTVTGGGANLSDPAYWVDQVRNPVRFADAVTALADQVDVILEVGPDSVLTILGADTTDTATFLPLLRRDRDESETLLSTLAAAHAHGVPVTWPDVPTGRIIDLPTYPFQRQRYWLDISDYLAESWMADEIGNVKAIGLESAGHPLLGAVVTLAGSDNVVFTGRLAASAQAWLADHEVFGNVLLPGTAFVEMAVRAGGHVGSGFLEELTLTAPLVVPQDGVLIQVTVGGVADDGVRRSVTVHSRSQDTVSDDQWILHAEGTLSSETPEPADSLVEWPPSGAASIPLDGAYERLAEAGYGYGPVFRGLQAAWRRGDEVFAEVRLPDAAVPEAQQYGVHPALLDAALHAVLVDGDGQGDGAVLPFAWSGVQLFESGASALRVRLAPAGAESVRIDAVDQAGRPVLAVEALVSRPVAADRLAQAGALRDTFFQVAWSELAPADGDGENVPVHEVTTPAGTSDGGDSVPAAVRDVVAGVLAAVQNHLSQEADSLLAIVTRGAVAVTDADGTSVDGTSADSASAAIDLVQAPVAGLVRAALAENPGRFVLVDVEPGTDAVQVRTAVQTAVAHGESEVAVRGGKLFVPRLTPLALAETETTGSVLDPDGTVLVTGGTSGLGAVVAKHLVTGHGARRLLLAGRRGGRTPGADELVAELTALGALVDVAACDVSDRDALAALVASIPAEHPLVGVVHAAGVLDDGLVGAMDAERMARVLGPKADAAWHLHELTADQDLGMFVLFSSAAGVLGGAGQSNYAAANTFLDALAAHRTSAGLTATSMAWGLWESPGTAGTAGMGGRLSEADVARLRRGGVRPLTESEGLALFDAALAAHAAHVVPVGLDLAGATSDEVPVLLSGLVRRRGVSRGSVGASGWVRRLAGLDAAGRLAAVLELVCAQAASTLGHASVSAVDADAVFRDLGFDSLSAVEFRNGLAGALGLRLPATLVFDYPSPRMLAEYVVGQLSGAARGSSAPVVRAGLSDEPVAIVGVGCRFPGGVASAAGLWDLVASGRDAIGLFPGNRGWDPASVFDPEPGAAGKSYTRHGGFLYDADRFDPGFFGISPNEALVMDPQQRLLLETAWEAFESAGIDPRGLRGSDTGVFAGMMYHDYAANSSTGAVASGRVSYVFGLQGPSMTVDTACSSSLVALHLAVQALRAGECSLALAGGVAVMATPEVFVEFSRQRGLAPDGRCKSFAAGADGTAWGEGAGLLLVERLSDAKRLGHPVLAVVRGSAVNQDGASNGLTAPNGPAQEKVIRAALATAGLSTADVDLVEAHGTGTVLGDPIEAQALLATYGQDRSTPVFLGSIKSNIGHTQAASGVAGVVKLIEAMRHGVMPKSLHIDEPSPHVDWSAGDVELLAEARQWPETGRPRRAAISSFGISGTNAHVILEQPEPTADDSVPSEVGVVPWVVSARSVEAVREQASRIVAQVRESGTGVADVAATLAHRAVFDHRLVVSATDVAQACAALESAEVVRAGGGRVGVVFTGQGAQRLGMGRELYARFPVFAAALDEVLDPAVREVMWGDDAEALSQTGMAQPALFAIEVALFRLLESFGIVTTAMAGHSIGEIAAAHVAGVLSLTDARALVSARASLMQQLPAGGAMLAVAAGEDRVAHLLSDGLAIAAVNAPGQVVLSGTAAAIDHAAEALAASVRVRRLSVSHAFHSPLMDPMLPAFAEAIAGLSFAEPTTPIISTVTGGRADLTDPTYWVDQVRNPVRFADAVSALADQVDVILEVGPDSVLTILGADSTDAAAFLPLLRRDRDESETVLSTLATAHAHGVPVTWPDVPAGRIIDLPAYPFQRQRFWLDISDYLAESWMADDIGNVRATGLDMADHPLLGAVVSAPDSERVVLTGRLAVRDTAWLADHVIGTAIVLPGTGLVEVALRAGAEAGFPVLDELTITAPLVVPAEGAVSIHVVVVPDGAGAGRRAVKVYSRPDGAGAASDEWTLHAQGLLAEADRDADFDLAQWPPSDAAPVVLDGGYEALAEAGYGYGVAFRGLTAAWRRGDEVFAEVALPETAAAEAPDYGLHPALLDAAMHAVLIDDGGRGDGRAVLPFAWTGVRLFAPGASALRVRLAPAGPEAMRIQVADHGGRPVLSVDSLISRPVSLDGIAKASDGNGLLHVQWREMPVEAGAATPATEVEVFRAPGSATGDVPADLRRVSAAVLAAIHGHLGQSADKLLAVVTRNGAKVRPADSIDVTQAPVWGLVRAAQAENPGRIVLLDTDTDTHTNADADADAGADTSTPEARLAAAARQAIAHDQPEAAIRDGALWIPRLAPLAPTAAQTAAPTEETKPHQTEPFDPEGTVLITGGTGGLGAVLARHLATAHGVRHLLLTSRRGLEAPGAQELAAELADLGTQVDIEACDVSDRDALARLLAATPHLTGVVHAAGIADNGLVTAMTPERLDTVFGPKADAAWHLHELTADREDLRTFVLFSSAGGMVLPAGQASYAAANVFLDALAQHRRAHGLPAVSTAYGLWATDTGLSAYLTETDFERLRRQGLPPLTSEQALAMFDAAVGPGAETGDGVVVPLAVDPVALGRRTDDVPALLRGLMKVTGRRGRRGAAGAGTATVSRLVAGLGAPERAAALLELVRTQIAAVLGHASAAAVEPDRAFQELGFDSLSSVELRNTLKETTGLRLPATLAFDYPSARAVAQYIDETLAGTEPDAPTPQSGASRRAADDDPIAIVAMACRYPGGATTPEELWRLVRDGVDTVTRFPDNRGWDVARIYDPEIGKYGKTYTREGAFLHDAAMFDPGFFGISPNEALTMDPQQRLLLETAWEAFERAGIDPATLRGSATGVYAGVMYHDYGQGSDRAYSSGGSLVSGRVSYTLGLEGPAVTVDTACSSSLVALHWAAQALRSGECSLALAGGVTVMSTPNMFLDFSRQRGLAPDGRCKSFAGAADGTAWGEGVGLLLMERLSDARRNGHPVLAVVRGSALNQDGASNGFTAPNGPSQRRLIRQALANAGLASADVDAVEAHGTGTTLGDPIEAQALMETYGRDRPEGMPLYLGSIKSNIGHTQAASGVAGIIKMVEAIRHGVLPKSLHIDEPSPHVDWTAGDVELLADEREWPETGRPRRAAVSSFGISGTNAHVILEQAAPVAARVEPPSPLASQGSTVAWTLSGRSVDAVRDQAARLVGHLRAAKDVRAIDVASSLTAGRTRFECRAVAVGEYRAELIRALQDIASGSAPVGNGRRSGSLAVVFTGQGSQRLGMGRGLYGAFPVFAAAFDEVLTAFDGVRDGFGRRVRDVAWGVDAEALESTDIAQAALFAFEVALFRLVEAWGVRPRAVAGHSIGQLAAAHVAGVWSLADACRIVEARGRLMAGLPAGGAMATIPAAEEQVLAVLGDGAGIAAVNGPRSVVVSGLEAEVDRVAALFPNSRRLRVSHAFHSALMEPMLEEFAEVVGAAGFADPRIDVVAEGDVTNPRHWVEHVRDAVRFADTVAVLKGRGIDTVLELGPDGTVCTLVGLNSEDIAAVPAQRPGQDEEVTLVAALGRVFEAGADVDWTAFHAGRGARRADLPTYAFQRREYWPDESLLLSSDASSMGLDSVEHPLLGAVVPLAGSDGFVLTGRLAPASQRWLADHRVFGTVLLPGTAFVEMAIRAGDQTGCGSLEELTLLAPLPVTETGVLIQVSVGPEDGGRRRVSIHSRPQDTDVPWTPHAEGVLAAASPAAGFDLEEWPPAGAVAVDVQDGYGFLAGRGYGYGPVFQGLKAAWRRGEEIFAEVALPEQSQAEAARYGLHPALLDAAMHALCFVPIGAGNDDAAPTMLPFCWTGVTLHASASNSLRVRLARTSATTLGMQLADATGAPVASVDSLILRPVSVDQLAGDAGGESLYRIEWVEAVAGAEGRDARVFEVPVPAARTTVPAAMRTAVTKTLAAVQEHLLGQGVLAVVTRGAVVTGEFTMAHAPVWGLVRAAQAENPGRFVLVDVLPGEDVPAAVAAALATGEPETAVRDGRVLMPRLVRQPGRSASAESAGSAESSESVAGEGTVLVTGGTGGLGAVIARRLVTRHGVRRLVLVSRRGIEAPGAAELVAELEELGAEAAASACDVSDRKALAKLLKGIPDLSGVVHAAGIAHNGLIGAMAPEHFDVVLRAKADAAWHLHELTRDRDLRMFVLFSSVGGLVLPAGQAPYAAANVFLDVLAEQRKAQGLAATSMSFGLWAVDTGLSAWLGEADLERLRRQGLPAMSPDVALASFDAAVAGTEAHVAPLVVDVAALRSRTDEIPALLRGLVPPARRRSSAGGPGAPTSAGLLRRLAPLDEAERTAVLRELVVGVAAALLGYTDADQIDPAKGFLESGFDSLSAVELRNHLNAATGLSLPPMAVFDSGSPAELAKALTAELGAVLGGESAEGRAADRPSLAGARAAGGEDSLSVLFRTGVEAGAVDEAYDMLRAVARMRPRFTSAADLGAIAPSVTLREGSEDAVRLICLSTPMATGGIHQHSRLVSHLAGQRRIVALPNPGFGAGEKLPATVGAGVEALAEMVLEAADGHPFVVLGYSSGGTLGYSVVGHLERVRGVKPAGLVMLDSFLVQGAASSGTSLPIRELTLGLYQKEEMFGRFDSNRLSGMACWFDLVPDLPAGSVAAPVLFVHCTEGFAEVEEGQQDWEAVPLGNGQTVVPIAANHFTIIEEKSDVTARIVEDWFARIEGKV